MTDCLFFLFFISSLVYWLAGWLLLPKIQYCRADKKPAPEPPAAGPAASVSIIIPARNEEKRLPVLLESLKAADAFHRFEVILADDDSDDRTAETAAAAGCRVIKAGNKPDSAVGKSWACAAGAEAAAGELLIFLDADVKFLPGGLDTVIAQYLADSAAGSAVEAKHTGLMSVQPYHRFKRFYESFSAFFNIMSAAGVNSFSAHSTGRNVKGAFGPCILCSAQDYAETGGHKAILDKLVDDLALAALFRKNGLPVRNYAGRGTIEYRMYPEGFSSLWRGWTKNMALASSASSKLTGLYFGIWCAGVANIVLSAGFSTSPLQAAAIIPVYLIYTAQTAVNLRKTGSWNFVHALIFPAYLIFFLLVMIASAVKTKIIGAAEWRGRKIKL